MARVQGVSDTLLRLKLQPTAMEFFVADPGELKTGQEFDLAQELGKPCFCYAVGGDYLWRPKLPAVWVVAGH